MDQFDMTVACKQEAEGVQEGGGEIGVEVSGAGLKSQTREN